VRDPLERGYSPRQRSERICEMPGRDLKMSPAGDVLGSDADDEPPNGFSASLALRKR